MAVLKITAFKATYRAFTGYTGAGVPQFSAVEHMRVLGCFDSEVSAARYAVDVLIKDWNPALGTLPDRFRLETKSSDKIYHVRPSEAGETPDLTSPTQGDYYFQAEHVIRG